MVQNTNIHTVTASTTLPTNIDVVMVNATGSPIIISLPPITVNGIIYTINRIDNTTQAVQILTGTPTLLAPRTQLRVVSYNSQWVKLPNQESIYQLFCNTGTFALPAADTTISMIGPNRVTTPYVGNDHVFMISRPGIIYNFYAHLEGYSSGTINLTVYRNNVPQALNIIANHEEVSDTDPAHAFTVVAGDYLTIVATNLSTINAGIYMTCVLTMRIVSL